eukprot:jgi/Chrzof1/1487/Cz10g09200.t1
MMYSTAAMALVRTHAEYEVKGGPKNDELCGTPGVAYTCLLPYVQLWSFRKQSPQRLCGFRASLRLLQNRDMEPSCLLAKAAYVTTVAAATGIATYPLARLPYESPPDPKNKDGMGTSTYINPVNIGHQLWNRAHP